MPKINVPIWPEYTEREIMEVRDVLASHTWNRWQGTKVNEFEKKFTVYQDAKYGVAVVNGTVALEIALRALDISPGAEVIIPAYTFISTATAVLQIGCVPVFADINPVTYCIDSGDIERKITDRTKVIIPVHLYGYPCEMDKIMGIAKKHNLYVLEDACQAPGAEWHGRKVGAIGDLGCFSFQASKNITCGEGGMIVTNNEILSQKCFSYHHIGRMPGGKFYEHEVLGTNARLSEFLGGILLAQFSRLEEQTRRREENARYISENLKSIPGITPPAEIEGVTCSAYHLYVFRYEKEKSTSGLSRNELIKAMNDRGVPCGTGYPIPLYKNPLFVKKAFAPLVSYVIDNAYGKKLDYTKAVCPETERICMEAIGLPQNILLGTKKDCNIIIETIKETLS